jgi:pimeloyl-ACP methyl ester carboxylesterase
VPEVQVSQGTVHYRDVGQGPTVVLIHGLMVAGSVWDELVAELADHARCVVPDLSPRGLAALIAELLELLELSDVTLVGNDTGGALCQLVCAHHRERIDRLVLINCDAFENFPPPALRPVVRGLGRVPGAVTALEVLGRLRFVRRAAMAAAPLTMKPLPDDLLRSWLAPLRDRGVRRDLVSVLRGISPEHTLEAAEHLRDFTGQALIVWGTADKFFPLADAERLAATLPEARVQRFEDCRTFVQIDAPERLATLIADFTAGRSLDGDSVAKGGPAGQRLLG